MRCQRYGGNWRGALRMDSSRPPSTIPAWVRAAVVSGASGHDRLETAHKLAAYFLTGGMNPGAVARAMAGFARACRPEIQAVELADIIRVATGLRDDAARVGLTEAPTVVPMPGSTGWRYTWPSAGISLTLARLTSQGGRLMAELTVDAGAPGTEVYSRLHGPSRLDLLSIGALEGAARWLGKLRAGPWGEVLEAAFRMAVESHRTGVPAILLRDAVDDPSGGYAIDPLVLEGDPTMLFAKGGAGKSLLALLIAAALDMGDGVLPLRVARRHRVAILDWEWRAGRHKPRLRAMLGDRIASCGIVYREMSGPLIGQIDQIQRLIAEHGITYLVIDSVALACGDDPEKSSSALPFANAVRGLGLGSLWVAHVPKHGDDTEPYGSAFWRNTVRSAWQVQSLSESGSATMRLALHHRKSNDGPPSPAIGLTLAWSGGRLTVTRSEVDPAEDRAFQSSVSRRSRVLGMIASGAATPAEIAESRGLNVREVERELSALVREGRAVELSGGRYGSTQPAGARRAEAAGPAADAEPVPLW